MYQKRRDSARFDHITTQQRVLWRMYCLHRQIEEREVFKLAFNYGALQALKKQKDELMQEAQSATVERRREILDEMTVIQERMESIG